MVKASKKYWKSLDELNQTPEFVEQQKNEFPQELEVNPGDDKKDLSEVQGGRRDFLKVLGFSVTAATIAASCEMPVRKSIPYLVKPEEITPGIANYYASSYVDGGEYCGVLVKTREGRPIKIEGNTLNPITKGNTSARVQASVLNLYDGHRLQYPMKNGEKTDWETVDGEILNLLEQAAAANNQVAILSSSIISPSLKKAAAKLMEKYGNIKHVTYDANSVSGLLDANEATFGKRVVPHYDFEKADIIVSIGADFLGNWISPSEYSNAYVQRRKVSKDNLNMNRHIQVEAGMSLAGANADTRVIVKPSEEAAFILHLYNALARKSGNATLSNLPTLNVSDKAQSIADELWAKRGGSLVVSGINNKDVQLIVNAINSILNNYNSTISISKGTELRQGSDEALDGLISELESGQVNGIIILDSNPVYDTRYGKRFEAAIDNLELSVYMGEYPDETNAVSTYTCPVHNYLEAWNDAQPRNGVFALGQPTIEPLFKTRHAGESFLKWAGEEQNMYDFIRKNWQENIFPMQEVHSSFNTFWDVSLHNGFAKVDIPERPEELSTDSPQIDVQSAAGNVRNVESGDLEIFFYEKVGIGRGKFANNPWLQELPDPISKVTWDNYATVSPKFAKENGFGQSQYQRDTKQFKLMEITLDNETLKLPVFIQPGQADNTIGLALGYGRKKSGKAGTDVGVNVYPFVNFDGKNFNYYRTDARFEGVSGIYKLASTQDHHSLFDGLNERPIAKETTLEEYAKNPKAGNEDRDFVLDHLHSLYPGHEFNGHHWGLAIDLNSCIGCGACAVACQAENNVPVVGRDEVANSREMHWIRIDRYYTGEADNPAVVFQPMMCQHCDNAPCENVCPVAATPHSMEGLNQMAYNRCIGTRYCANNCPYKVRRFNWFDYQNADSFTKGTIFDNVQDELGMTEDLTRMVLNPDVTVRARGVMEKCSFCVQRIQEGKLNAKKDRRKLEDGDIKTACQTACASNAIVFGDLNNPESMVAKVDLDERTFKVIEEIHTLPSVSYKTKVRNRSSREV
ncbi:MAG: 4Fe-4S dicluster domain-containing protein [Chitinophagaceae bacterium]|nr:MAG: 4Fe-4S dicluster domain-containing protein [Chitinophagaceae bacterium]